jgi:hypothetical protein
MAIAANPKLTIVFIFILVSRRSGDILTQNQTASVLGMKSDWPRIIAIQSPKSVSGIKIIPLKRGRSFVCHSGARGSNIKKKADTNKQVATTPSCQIHKLPGDSASFVPSFPWFYFPFGVIGDSSSINSVQDSFVYVLGVKSDEMVMDRGQLIRGSGLASGKNIRWIGKHWSALIGDTGQSLSRRRRPGSNRERPAASFRSGGASEGRSYARATRQQIQRN